MSEPDPFSDPPTPTARGDRDGRRRDVLAAATSILEESGWEGLSIRAVASRAGVSTGAVYQWFSGKDEIFGELMAHEIRAGLDLIERVPTESFPATVRLMLDWVTDLYERLGRYELEFAEASTGRTDREIAAGVDATYLELGKRADELLDRAAANDGIELIQHEYRVTWFWAGCVGTAERLALSPQIFFGETREELLQLACDSLVRSLVAR
ncbi:MAG: TetR/AcrR family transcriptional regulator [Acidimicrobiales bacterium]|nr:TetR/AcrR family transcriptional regulator [Acidimicrobiales bacterium]